MGRSVSALPGVHVSLSKSEMSNSSSPVIETARLLLRQPVIGDLDDLFRLWTTPEVFRFISGKPSTREECWARLLRYIGHWTAFGYGFFGAVEKASGRYVGECGLMDFRREISPLLDDSAEAGWVFSPQASGKGLATEAMSAILDWYGMRPDAKPLACIIAPENTASIGVAKKLGFVRESEALYRGQAITLFRRPLTSLPMPASG